MYRNIMIRKMALYMLRILSLSGFLMFYGATNQVLAGDFPDGNQLYVATNGNDNVSRVNNSLVSPWQTINKAMLTAEPGDVVNFRAGVYPVTSEIFTNDSTSASNGTADNRIVYTNYQNESVLFTANTGYKIRIDKQYWTISGIDGETNNLLFHIGSDRNGDNIIIEDGVFTLTESRSGPNLAPIMFQTDGSDNGLVLNCRFFGPGSGLNENTAGIFAFRSKGLKVLNNEFSGFPTALFYKHPGVPYDTGIEFAYNYFHGNKDSITSSSIYGYIHDNLFVDGALLLGLGSGIGDDGKNAGADFNTITHNTFYKTKANLIGLNAEGFGATNNILRENVFMNEIDLIPWKDINHNTTLDYNLYPTSNAVLNNGRHYSLSAWQSFYGQDVRSISGVPVFVGGASPSSINGYALSASSPGYKKASDGGDMGALMKFVGIGRQDGVAPPKPPLVNQ